MKKKKKAIYFEEGENFNIPNNSEVTVVKFGNKKMLIKHTSKKQNNLKRYKRVDRKTYIDTYTGELLEYEQKETYKVEKEINKSMKELKETIKTNFTGADNELFITLTQADENNMELRDIKKYTSYFLRRLKDKFPDSQFEYIYKYERQENGKWHLHILLKDVNNKTLFIDNEIISKLWREGFTNTQKIQNDEDSISRLISYMIKKTQLQNFPRGERIYNTSRGIIRPVKIKTNKATAIAIVELEGLTLTNEKTILIKSTKTGAIINKHKTEEYEKK